MIGDKVPSAELLPARGEPELQRSVSRAAVILRNGGLVAFPTETVYGLGADARSESAVRKIFEAKGRPAHNPLIVHCGDAEAATQWTSRWDERAARLAEAFWPGPLTLVLPLGKGIAPTVVAGGQTVALRVPRHPVALALLRTAGIPLAAPSANRSNRLSPTSAEAVTEQLGDRIDAILDGGPCDVGIESTVLDLAGEAPRILRPGMVTAAAISEIIGAAVAQRREGPGGTLRSPGLLPRHYCPRIPLRILAPGEPFPPNTFRIRIGEDSATPEADIVLPGNPEGTAAGLYAALRAGESSGRQEIVIECPPDGTGWEGIHDRLARAAHRGNPECPRGDSSSL